MTQVKRGCMKRIKDRDVRKIKKVRTVMRIKHIKLMIKMFYKKPTKKVWAFMLPQMFLYFGMRWYDDIKEITLGDVKVLNEGNLEVYVWRSKTD